MIDGQRSGTPPNMPKDSLQVRLDLDLADQLVLDVALDELRLEEDLKGGTC